MLRAASEVESKTNAGDVQFLKGEMDFWLTTYHTYHLQEVHLSCLIRDRWQTKLYVILITGRCNDHNITSGINVVERDMIKDELRKERTLMYYLFNSCVCRKSYTYTLAAGPKKNLCECQSGVKVIS